MKKKVNCIKNTMALGIILFLLYSCSNELTIVMPNGPTGPAGASAYDVWVQAVKDGIINWDVNLTDINNYFLYLKGQDGKDGKDGQNGLSAYDLWVQEVANGIDDPHNPGQQWPKDQVSIQDFWYFLTGAKGQDGSPPTIGANGNWFIDGKDTGIPAKGQDGKNGQNGQNGSVITIGSNGNWFIDGVDTGVTAFGQNGKDGQNGQNGQNGQSAYDLWVQEVLTGNLDDPHNPGQKWPKTRTSTQDFWDFLRGSDGNSTEIDQPAGGETGQPGEDIRVVLGKPNVIPQYVSQPYNEFVRWEDGSVGYIVYNDAGEVAPGAIVKGLPGMDPSKTYTADANGFFLIPKEDLPDNESLSSRRGVTTSVTYTNSQGTTVTEASAPNTYVPDRMYVRLRLQTPPVIDGTYMRFPAIVVERETDGGAWQMIPTYLGNLNQNIYAYSVDDPNAPASYNAATIYSADVSTINISTASALRVNRLRKAATYYHPVTTSPLEWDGNDHYFTLVLDGYYGEKPQTAAVIQMAPIQAMPMITNITAYTYSTEYNFFSKIVGEMDIDVTTIDYSLVFKDVLNAVSTTIGGTSYTYYSPAIEDETTCNDAKQFTVRFNVAGNPTNNTTSRSSISDPSFSITPPSLGSSVLLECNTSYFYSLNTIGYLRFGTSGDLRIESRGTYLGWTYSFADIPVDYIP